VANTTDDQPDSQATAREPWQSWGATARFTIVRLAQTMPTAMLVWIAYFHR
jgi:hypothetical protein